MLSLLFAFLFAAGNGQDHAPPKDVVLVPKKAAECVASNRRDYLSLHGDPVVIYLPLCPNPDPRPSEIARLRNNSGYVTIRERQGRPVRSILITSKSGLPCVIDAIQHARKTQGDDFVEVNLSRCAKR